MPKYSCLLLAVAACIGCYTPVFSQNILISSQNPDALYVCGADTLYVTVQNTSAGTATDPVIAVSLHHLMMALRGIHPY